MQIDVLRPKETAGALADSWRGLQRRCPLTGSPFLSPAWASAVEEARGGRGVRVAVFSERGRPVSFMPFQAGRLTAIAAGGTMSDYEGLIGNPGEDFDLVEAIRLLGVSRYDFNFVPEIQAPFLAHARARSRSWVADLPRGYGPYAAAKRAAGTSALRELERKRRKAAREAGPVVFAAHSRARADFDRLIELKRRQYRATGQTDVFAAGWTLRLVETLYEARPEGCVGALFTLHFGEALAAAQFHLAGEGAIHAWIIAHEPRFERYTPGLLLFQEILKWMDGQPQDRLDFGYGDYRFKRELATGAVGLVHGFVGAPSAASLVRGAAWGVRRAAESLPLGPFSAWPGKAMRRLDTLRGLR